MGKRDAAQPLAGEEEGEDGDEAEDPETSAAEEAESSGSRANASSRRCRRPSRLKVMVAFTLAGGVVVLMFCEGMPCLDAIYVVTQIVTTVGYGDITVINDATRVFMAFYVLWLLILAASFLNTLIQNIIDEQAERVKERLRILERAADRRLHIEEDEDRKRRREVHDSAIYAGLIFVAFVAFGTAFFSVFEHCSCSYGITLVQGCTEETACETGRVKTLSTAFYMSIVTLTTVGFGDFTPVTQCGRFFAIFWMMGGIVSTAHFVSHMQEVFLREEEQRRFSDALEMNEESFRKIDRDSNGFLSRSEFVNYVLVKHGLVDHTALDQISNIYDMMDKSSDRAVTFEEVVAFQQEFKRRKPDGL